VPKDWRRHSLAIRSRLLTTGPAGVRRYVGIRRYRGRLASVDGRAAVGDVLQDGQRAGSSSGRPARLGPTGSRPVRVHARQRGLGTEDGWPEAPGEPRPRRVTKPSASRPAVGRGVLALQALGQGDAHQAAVTVDSHHGFRSVLQGFAGVTSKA
jgi:hypothetical protein